MVNKIHHDKYIYWIMSYSINKYTECRLPSRERLAVFANYQHVATIPMQLQLVSFESQAWSSAIRLIEVDSLYHHYKMVYCAINSTTLSAVMYASELGQCAASVFQCHHHYTTMTTTTTTLCVKKRDAERFAVTSSVVIRFLKFFHFSKQK